MDTNEQRDPAPGDPLLRSLKHRWPAVLVVLLVWLDCASTVIWWRWSAPNASCSVLRGVIEVSWWPPEANLDYGSGPAVGIAPPAWHPLYFQTGEEYGYARVAAMPLWVATLGAVALAFFIERRRRGRKGACATCGYPLTGLGVGVCPECGSRPSEEPPLTGGPLTFGSSRAALLWILIPVVLAGSAWSLFRVLQWTASIFSRIACRQDDGATVPAWLGDSSADEFVKTDGPFCGGHLYLVSVVPGSAQGLWHIPVDQLDEWSQHGIPAEYVVTCVDR